MGERMTLDEAIKHAEEMAEKNEKKAKSYPRPDKNIKGSGKKYNDCIECASEHRQLAEWLKDYKRLLEQEIITEIPKDYLYDTETEDFLVYRHKYTGDEIHIERPVPLYRLEQEPKTDALDKIRAEIE